MSTTPIILQPTSTLAPADGNLDDILQPWLVGISGLTDSTVFIKWQLDPPPYPDARMTNWMALGARVGDPDWDAHIKHVGAQGDEPAYDLLRKQETIEVMATIYGPDAATVCTRITSAVQISTNRQYLLRYGLVWVKNEKPVPVNERIKRRWVRRVDLRMFLRRAVSLRYPVQDIESVSVSLHLPGYQTTVVVESQTEPSEG